ncbi:MAG: 1-acyl-sn-glycerol-3-phosphate acyltransferase, partial [Pseudomonadota bacterium]|nr:1-acyl-sn-glycerol-3-phosphate acyltransferase [Pseudomonadota bacterium]
GFWCLPVWVARRLGKTVWRDRLVRLCYKGILPILGVHLKTTGRLDEGRPLLVVSNHLSYLDVCILGSQAPVRFTPKSEIASWPLIGGICRLCGDVFVDRRPDKVRESGDALRAALARGEAVSLFPEATTGNGRHLLPFKSGFFSLAEEPVGERELLVQPAAIAYTRIRRLPVDSTQWPLLAWYGDMPLVPHLWELLKLGSVSAELVFLPATTLSEHGDRKHLAAHCRHAIAAALASVREAAVGRK